MNEKQLIRNVELASKIVLKEDEKLFKELGKVREIKCPNCGYDGSDLEIGRKPISNPMMCSKCRRYFNP